MKKFDTIKLISERVIIPQSCLIAENAFLNSFKMYV